MRGLAIPATASTSDYQRELSNEYGTEFSSNNDDNIPIDPALGGTPIDPLLLAQQPTEQNHIPNTEPTRTPPREPSPILYNQYSQAPQGDPFAPQPEYHPILDEPPPPPSPSKPPRRRRAPPRERECGFCIENNRSRDGERLVTCYDCGRSAHPSCLELSHIGELIETYNWNCIECKKCEVCLKKGADDRMLFCDSCDRGWHTDCLNPPVENVPDEKWYCPRCPDVVESERATSVASSSRLMETPKASKGKGKAIAISDDEEDDSDEESEEEEPVAPQKRGRGRPPRNPGSSQSPSKKAKRPRDSPRSVKRLRLQPPKPPASTPSLRLRLPKVRGRQDNDEEPPGLLDDILPSDDRDTSKTFILPSDKQKFEKSRASADVKLGPAPHRQRRTSDPDTPGPSSRPLRSSMHQSQIPSPSASPAPSSVSGAQGARHHHGDHPAPLRISTIRFGQYDIKTWYNAPFPEEYSNLPEGRLWICEFCLKYMKSHFVANRHRMKCKSRNPPGDEIYRDDVVSIFEVDGRKNKIYCQNLCLLSKMFLDHKSLFYDVEPFLFYVITEVDDCGARFVGYFSKEKRSPKDYNVSCIMTLPVRQRQGWGNLLIDFSYLLSKKERRLGSPEKPLSALGALGYRNYWTLALMRYLATAPDRPRLEDICFATSMTVEDVHATLVQQNMITVRETTPPRIKPSPGQSIKFPKGRKNGVARRHLQRTQTEKARAGEADASKEPFVPPTQYEIRWERSQVVDYLTNWESKGYLQLKPEKLQWSPYILAKMNKPEAPSAADINALLTTEKLAAQGLLVNGVGPQAFLPLNGQPSTPNGVAASPAGSPILEDQSDDDLPTGFPSRDRRTEVLRSTSDPPRILRSRSTQQTPLASTPSRGMAGRLRRGASAKGKGKEKQATPSDDENDDEDDGAEAAEDTGRRLRSRDVAPGLPSLTHSRRASPKKRRRVDSSSEDEAPSPRRSASTAFDSTVHSPADVDTTACAQELPQINGLGATRQPIGVVCSTNGDSPADSNASPPIIKTIVVQTGGDGEAVKSEDPGTPFTTERQSEDTVFIVDPASSLEGNVKGLNGAVAIVVEAWKHERETVQEVEQNDEPMLEDVGDDADADADADADVDAEGEEDDGEDVDMG
ncbi:histone acetyltransferase [Favolaschia claudopus]|uniref:Histone acetyltransferase n=1 Tax=Favolaschia claudopus TaxID=2862362 RepID=A0AAW0C108_9AGAR